LLELERKSKEGKVVEMQSATQIEARQSLRLLPADNSPFGRLGTLVK